MVLQRVGNALTTDFTGKATEETGSATALQSPTYQQETTYTPQFSKWNYYYKNIPEARTIIETLVKWVFGKGYLNSDPKEIKKLEKIVGNGKENALRVLKNVWKISRICGDGFAHIIKDNSGRLVNLKVLNPENISIIYDKYGIITRYEQFDTNNKTIKTFEQDEMLHISNGRIGDEIHGTSVFECLETIINSRTEVIKDLRVLFHRFVKPIRLFFSDTDDTTENNKLAAVMNTAYEKAEIIIAPKGSVEPAQTEIVSTQTGGLSPLEYYSTLVRIFITACGVPEVIMGWGKDTTEASSKIIYLAWEQTIEDLQLEVEDDLKAQLKIKINLEFPASIEEEVLKDEQKDTPINQERKSEIKPSNPQMKIKKSVEE